MQRRKEMTALLARGERDGLSLRALSEETEIPFGTLSWWSWRLRRDSVHHPSDEQFVEVAVTPLAHGEVVVRVADVEIAASAGTDINWLRDLVSALRPC